MWKKKEISVSSSSVVDLKAELFRAQEEFQKEKLRTGSSTLRAVSTKPIKVPSSHITKPPTNKGVAQRAKKDVIDNDAERIEPSLEASWVALKRKAEVYERLAREGGGGDVDGDDEKEETLVDFLMKNAEGEKGKGVGDAFDSEDPWVEAVDEFGRTRIVRRSQVEGQGLRRFTKVDTDPTSATDTSSHTPTLMSSDMRQEAARQEWEQSALASLQSPSSPAQTPHFDSAREIRTLGTGFYQFSQSAAERQKQMDDLKKIREETVVGRESVAGGRERRRGRVEERREALRERKRRRVEQGGDKREGQGEKEQQDKEGGDEEGNKEGDVNLAVDDFLAGIVGNV
ncbi:uncharacterized protein EV422DRAFT_498109 [Fimicolochytrium jonesii]|uniref:uncharacterized protein n=1 Tax=Fimicolochytrium jonesii TaxID=1396493 RepID=UPI0022FE8137|nr:uncharacterized protein EV422DRAFT_498109 [Fimicolochytrium jonesii]KAI8819121.1 hypothetical protein EV422DRAFT_498109 [Fimicolochytrium jonesii]